MFFCKTNVTEKGAVFEQTGMSDEKDNTFMEIEIQILTEPVTTQVQTGTSDGEKPLTRGTEQSTISESVRTFETGPASEKRRKTAKA